MSGGSWFNTPLMLLIYSVPKEKGSDQIIVLEITLQVLF